MAGTRTKMAKSTRYGARNRYGVVGLPWMEPPVPSREAASTGGACVFSLPMPWVAKDLHLPVFLAVLFQELVGAFGRFVESGFRIFYEQHGLVVGGVEDCLSLVDAGKLRVEVQIGKLPS